MTQLTAGKPEPLGARFDGKGVNFTLFSAHAERVELCVFDGEGNEHRYDLPARTGDTWHGYLAGGRPGMHYGFRVHGPWDPAQGHWFNPAKLLIDPCAHRVDGEFKDDPLFHVGYGEPDHRDSAPVAPKSVVVNDLSNNATITSILIDGMTYQVTGQQLGYEECSVGKVLVPTTGGTSGMCVVVIPVG